MTKRKIGIALAVVLAGAGAVWIGANWGIEQTDDAQLQSHLYQVSSRIPGTVDRVLVDAHDPVQPDQPLVLLDSGDQRMQVLRAETDLLTAQRQADAARVTVGADRSDASAGESQARGDQLDARAELCAPPPISSATKPCIARAPPPSSRWTWPRASTSNPSAG